jgi:hypothetical protein
MQQVLIVMADAAAWSGLRRMRRPAARVMLTLPLRLLCVRRDGAKSGV